VEAFAGLEDEDLVAEGGDFVGGVGDVEHRDVELVAEALQVGDDGGLEFLVEAGERLVHQQQTGRGEDGAGEGDALFLAAGKFGDGAIEQRIDFQYGGDMREVDA